MAEKQDSDPGAVWRAAFLRGPHLRDAVVRLGLVAETFETAITWDRFAEFHEGVLAAVRQAMDRACGGGVVSCRFAYVYPDGPAPYYSVYAPGRPAPNSGSGMRSSSRRSSISAYDHPSPRGPARHRCWYLREVPPLFTDALRRAKAELDPAGIMNPGVLMHPAGSATTP